METVIIPSKSKPNKPHAICEWPDCSAYSSSSICAHAIAASVKINRLDAFLKWLVTTKRKTGGVNYTKAVMFGMPIDKGRTPNQPPRKRKKAKHPTTDDLVIIPRITDEQHTNVNMPQNSQLQYKTVGPDFSVSQPMPNCRSLFCSGIVTPRIVSTKFPTWSITTSSYHTKTINILVANTL